MLEELFGVSEYLAAITFNKVGRVMVLSIKNMSKCQKLMQSGKPSLEDFLRIMNFLL